MLQHIKTVMNWFGTPLCSSTQSNLNIQAALRISNLQWVMLGSNAVFHCCVLCRRKSKQALRDYKKVLLQLETMEINVGDQCRKEFTGTPSPVFTVLTLFIQAVL